MSSDDDPAPRQEPEPSLIEARLRDRAAALTAEGRPDLAELVRAWADLHALRKQP